PNSGMEKQPKESLRYLMQVNANSNRYDQMVLKLKTRKSDRGTKIRPIATGTKKAGPIIPTVVGIRQVKKSCLPAEAFSPGQYVH
ncbi:hypothetical protein ACFLX6_03105, partial [Chloroflexota bacterium]